MLRTIFNRKQNFIPVSATADTFEIEYDPEIVLPPSSGQPKPPGALQTTYEVWYLGSKQIPEAKSISTLFYTIKQVLNSITVFYLEFEVSVDYWLF